MRSCARSTGEPQLYVLRRSDGVAELDLSAGLAPIRRDRSDPLSDRRRWSTATGRQKRCEWSKTRAASTTLSFDPNCRPRLVHDKAEYVDRMNYLPRAAGIVRLSDSDFAFLYGGHEYAKRAEALFAADTKLFIVTRGIRGAQAWHKRAGVIEVETPQVEVVDTIGAGDSFQAGLLFALRAMGRIAPRRARRDDRRTNSIARLPLQPSARLSPAVGAAPILPISLRLELQRLQTSFKPIQVTGLPQEFEEWQPHLIIAPAIADLAPPVFAKASHASRAVRPDVPPEIDQIHSPKSRANDHSCRGQGGPRG